MQCLIMATEDASTTVLRETLREHGLDAVFSADLGAGAALASADLASTACAVAVLPGTPDESEPLGPGFAAILIEIGVALGCGIPTMIITNPGSEPSPALATVPRVAAHLDDRSTLRLHLDVFVKTAVAQSSPVPRKTDPSPPLRKLDIESYRSQLRNLLGTYGPTSAAGFERFIVDLLSAASGGQVESNVRQGDHSIDAVIGLGGPTGAPLVVLVEIKMLAHTRLELTDVVHQLLRYLLVGRANLGLIVVDKPISDAARAALPPAIVAFSADELLDRLSREPLDHILRRARNRAVHGA